MFTASAGGGQQEREESQPHWFAIPQGKPALVRAPHRGHFERRVRELT
jgi:hypothetical protein